MTAALRNRTVPALTVLLVLVALGLVAPAGPAAAAARVDVVGLDGRAAVAADGTTTLTLTGTGFQSVPSAHGGIYVLFGWVDTTGSWRPSQGGLTGQDLRYVPDSESADNAGHQRFVAFPGSDTAAAANGGVVDAGGTWSTTLLVPGARFTATDRSGAPTEVDCTQVTCGVITIGAHGVKNATNETFTPVDVVPRGAAVVPAPASDEPAAAPAPATSGAPTTAAAPTPGAVRVGVDSTTVVQGRVVGFTGQGFTPGEQVVAALAGGLAALGPLVAGAHGEVAGVLQLPADLRPGTHVLGLTAAASGAVAEVELTVVADPVVAAAAAGAAAEPPVTTPATVAVGVAALLLVVLVVSSAVTARRRRRAGAVAVLPSGAVR
ncbi:hypothetical protein [Cellulomonas sp. SLBN-39]|uniref:hypothetical protein n=1 Tax=Cellulomonas sp. SLBN-39 TaxID=2768446 RepID=UPI001153580A|nr:hypothetical protein [Cellulomonas sp. SLBN-39]TQL01279.1 hypothetical protein FBY24_0326 [Cellulomonas sp. SLBN-39]